MKDTDLTKSIRVKKRRNEKRPRRMKQKGKKLCGEPKPEDENINKFVTEKCTTDQNPASDINIPVMKQKENN